MIKFSTSFPFITRMSEPLPQLSPAYVTEYKGGQLIGLSAAFIPILIIFVALRFWARIQSKAPLGLDDVFVACALVLQIGLSAFSISDVNEKTGFVKYGGVGRHFLALQQTEPERIVTYFKFLRAGSTTYFFLVAFPKLAILALYLRLFTIQPYQRIIYGTAAVVALTAIVCPIVSMNMCRPFEHNWNKNMAGHCLDEVAFDRWGSFPNIVTDIVIMVVPMPIVWRLQASTRMKIGLTILFLTGSLGLATSIVRFISFFRGDVIRDGTWSSVDLMIWTVVEPAVYLIAACLPTYRPLLIILSRKMGWKLTSAGTDNFQSFVETSKPRKFDATGFTGLEASFNDDIGLVGVDISKGGRGTYNQSDSDYTINTAVSV
ncbi:hypothetical protein LSUE1_G005420 [Lachnellula suecica]|uniref:Rhodopsin domain-containing protein n=1 Tax=Lachnellula suecica TaxID=602035 RepID=A0A8T9C5F0_9HELO|nr:hypothetical protein LSUE1_G005420 [Lachnellula suecica]